MVTKSQFANMIIDNYCDYNELIREDVIDWGIHAVKDSSLAVCLEYLDMLPVGSVKNFASTLNGKEYTSCKFPNLVLGTRELISLLPDDKCDNHDYIHLKMPTNKMLMSILESIPEDYFIYTNGINDVYLNIDHDDKTVVVDCEPVEEKKYTHI